MKLPVALKKAIDSVREYLKRLTPAQRVSFGMLGAVIAVGVLTMAFARPASARMVALPHAATAELVQFLDANKFEHELNDLGQVLVRHDRLQSILGRLVDSDAGDEQVDVYEWILQDAGLNETNGRMNLKLNDSQRRFLEAAISEIDGIKSARVIVNKKEHAFRVTEDTSSTASIQLTLDDKLGRLGTRSARNAARLVAFGLGIPLARVAVSDNRGNDYKLDENAQILADGRQEREREIADKISSAIFDGDFAPGEYRLSVNLTVNSTRLKERTVAYDPDRSVNTPKRTYEEKNVVIEKASLNAPGTKPNVSGFTNAAAGGNAQSTHERKEVELSNSIGMSEIQRETPSGDEAHWNVVAKVSKPALLRMLQQEKALTPGTEWKPTPQEVELEVQRVTERLKQEIETLLSAKGEATSMVTATVSTFMQVAREVAAEFGDPNPYLAFAMAHLEEILLAMLGLVGLFLLYRIAVGGVHELEPLPDPVAQLAAYMQEKEDQQRRELEHLAQQQEPKKPAAWEVPESDKKDIDLLQEITGYTKERPEIAAAVVRHWMSNVDAAPEPSAETAEAESVEHRT